jgi:hypothetical protein
MTKWTSKRMDKPQMTAYLLTWTQFRRIRIKFKSQEWSKAQSLTKQYKVTFTNSSLDPTTLGKYFSPKQVVECELVLDLRLREL